MELRQLNTFLVVAEAGGFTRAAELLGYAHSSISAQIQALEEELGVRLFDRLGKKVVLTDSGRRLLRYAQEIQKLQALAKEAVQTDETPSGTIRIGCIESLAVYRLPPILKEYKKLYPKVQMILRPGVCWELRNQVRKGDLDLAILMDRESQFEDLASEILVREQTALIAPVDHPLAAKQRMDLRDLEKETLLLTEPDCSYRSQFEQCLQRVGIKPAYHLEFWNIEAIKHCVMSGIGISFLPMITVANEIAHKKLAMLSWDDQEIQVSTQLVYHKAKWMSPAIREFIRIVHKHAANWQ